MRFQSAVSWVALWVVLLFVTAAPVSAAEKDVAIKGYVLDSACAFTKDLKKPISQECAVACAKAGSPLVILSDDGVIYWPISDTMPATGQNARLMEFAGKKVAITGKAFTKGGSHAVVIKEIKAAAGAMQRCSPRAFASTELAASVGTESLKKLWDYCELKAPSDFNRPQSTT